MKRSNQVWQFMPIAIACERYFEFVISCFNLFFFLNSSLSDHYRSICLNFNWQGLRAVHWWNCLLRRVQCISTSHMFCRQWFAINAVYHLQNHLHIIHRLDWSSLHAPAQNDLWMILWCEMKIKEKKSGLKFGHSVSRPHKIRANINALPISLPVI